MLLKSLVTLLEGGGFVAGGCEILTALPHLLQKLASSGSLLPQFRQNIHCLLYTYAYLHFRVLFSKRYRNKNP